MSEGRKAEKQAGVNMEMCLSWKFIHFFPSHHLEAEQCNKQPCCSNDLKPKKKKHTMSHSKHMMTNLGEAAQKT